MANDIEAFPRMSRRHFFGIGAGGLLLAACGGGDSDEAAFEIAASKFFSDQTVIADGSPMRTIWSLRDDEGNLGDLAPDTIEYVVLDPNLDQIDSGTAHKHIDGVVQPYYPVEVRFDEVGVYEFKFTTAEHGNHVGFVVPEDPETNTLLWPGDQFPSVVTPTLENNAGISQICTRSEICPFHDVSLDASLAGDRPTALIVSTPAFCGTVFMCGPVLELLIEEIAAGSYDIDVIHAEVYVDPQPDDLGAVAPVIHASGVSYEPFIFLFDSDGSVVRRLDHIFDRAELQDLLALT
jgi:hypothetical protein